MAQDKQNIVDEKTLQKVSEQAELSWYYLVFMALAGVLAAVALLTNSVPILVGAMIVAPAFPPLALVAFALLGARKAQAFKGIGVAVLGLFLSGLFAVITTWILNITNVIPPETNLLNKPLLEERVHPGWYSVVAAFAAGVVGTMALLKKKTDSLIGTVAALALVPAVAAAGIAFLSSDPMRGFGGLILLGINAGLIVVMGIVVLLIIRPGQKD